ncbi:melanoregulin isoform 1-T5 [Spinachia spinachia]
MGAKFTICCCRYYRKHNSGEEDAILRMRTGRQPAASSGSSDSDAEEESLSGPRPCGRRTNGPRDSPTRGGSDRELQAFISMRDQADKATEEWEKLNYDIHSLRYARREVRSRWRKILLQLGYQREVDALLCVNKHRRLSRDQDRLNRAAELLEQLLDRTSLFPPETDHQSKYLCVMDRLVSLDSAEDFVRLAKEKYPQQSRLRDDDVKNKT